MDVLDNPFLTLDATLRDNRQRIMELAEEKSLLADEELILTASSMLTNPRKRLSAEVAWLPGLGPKRASELVSMIKENPADILEQENIPALARANLLVAGLNRMAGKIEKDDLVEWIIEVAGAYDDIEVEEALSLINEEREVSGFPQVTDQHAIDAEIDGRRHHFRAVVKDVLNGLDSTDLVEVLTDVVESTTEMGELSAPLLIDDLVDTYEVEAQEFLDKEEENINALLDRIQTSADGGASESIISPFVEDLIRVVKNWDVVAQPIQVSTKSRGLGHEASSRVAHKVRDVAIQLFNKHDKLVLSQKITSMLQEVFAEVVDVADRTEEDTFTLDEIAERRKLGDLLDPISELCVKALEGLETRPASAYSEAKRVSSTSRSLLKSLQDADAPESIVSAGKDEIALTLMQCAIAYGNETSKWNECVEVLENAMEFADSQEAQKRIRANLLTANQNKALYGGLEPISSTPTLYTINGFGFTLYGSTDFDPVSRSHMATYYFTALFFPIFPISRYRVIQDGNSYRFLGKGPLRQFDKIHLAVSIVLIATAFIAVQ